MTIEKCSSPIGGRKRMSLKCQEDFISIEKCSSPIGDGNDV